MNENTALDRKLWLFLALHEFINSKEILGKSRTELLRELFNEVSKEIDQIARNISEWFPKALREFVHNTYEQVYQIDVSKRKYVQINIPIDSTYRFLPPDLTSMALLIKLLSLLKKYIVCVVTQKDFEEFKNKVKWCRRIIMFFSGLIYVLSCFWLNAFHSPKILGTIAIASSILLTISIRTNLEDLSVKEAVKSSWNLVMMLFLSAVANLSTLIEFIRLLGI